MDGRIDIDSEIKFRKMLAEMSGALAKGMTVRELCENASRFTNPAENLALPNQVVSSATVPLHSATNDFSNLEVPVEPLKVDVSAREIRVEVVNADIAADCNLVTTLGEAADRYFTLVSGKFATATRTMSDQFGFMLDIYCHMPRTTPLAGIKRNIYTQIWRGFAIRFAAGETRTVFPGKPRSWKPAEEGGGKSTPVGYTIPWGGPIHCEKAIRFFAGFMGWLFENELMLNELSLPSKWVEQLKIDWQQITTRPAGPSEPDVEALRFSEEQLKAMIEALKSADRRLRLLIELGMEARLGQARRTMRSGLNLDIPPHGLLKTFGIGKKKGTESLLTLEQRTLVDFEIDHGYLRFYERLYQQGSISDYPLFFGGRLNSKPDPNRRIEPLTESGLRKMFNALETAAGISHMHGRGWYGIRRAASDLSLAVATTLRDSADSPTRPLTDRDRHALNSLTGHTQDSSRERYEAKQVEVIRRRAAEIRGETRRRLGPIALTMKPPLES